MKGIRHKVILTDFEEALLQELVYKFGYQENVIFTTGLRLLHHKEKPRYGPYKKKEKSEEGSSEEYSEVQCLADGGEVIEKDGVKQCQIEHGALVVYKVIP